MGIQADIELIDAGIADAKAFQRLRKFLLSEIEGDADLYDAVSVYLTESPIVDWQVAEKYVKYPKDPEVAAAAISAGALRLSPSANFWSSVEEVASGEAWDKTDDARIQALLALNRSPFRSLERTKKILRESLKSGSAAVRDSTAIAVQRCFGVPENQVVAGGEAGELFTRLPKQMVEWLASK